MKPTRLAAWCIACIGVFHVMTIRSGHRWGDDFSLYIQHAKNLVEGAPYAQTGYLYNPHEPIPRAYPPVFPLCLSLIYRWFGLNLTAMKIEGIVFFLASLFMIYLVFRKLVTPPSAVAIMAMVGFNPYFWDFKDDVLSDFLFLLLTYLTLFVVTRARQSPPASRVQVVDNLLAGILALLACETRTVGVVLLVSVLAADLIRWKRPTVATGLFVLPLLAFLVLPLHPVDQTASYLEIRTPFNWRWALMNAEYYSKELRDLWQNGYTRGLMRAIFLSMNGLLALGCWVRLKRGITVYEIFSLLYVLVIFLWPHYQGIRYFMPVIPLYLFYAVVGFDWLTSRLRSGSKRVAVVGVLTVIVGSYAARYTTLDYGPIREGIERPETVELLTYLKRASPTDAVYVFFKPRLLALFTGHQATGYHTATDDELLGYFDQIGAHSIIVTHGSWRDQEFLRPFVERHPARLEPVFHNPEFTVYRLRRIDGFR